MDLGLNGARAIITGGSRGIGLAIARELAGEGVSVGLIARRQSGLDAARAELRAFDVDVATAAADVLDAAALGESVARLAEALGGVDKVVANAGGTIGNNLRDSTPDELLQTFSLNAGHSFQLIKAALPYLRESADPAVVLIASITGMRPAPRATYATAKAAQIHFAAVAAQELAEERIRVNSVSPGSILFDGGNWERYRAEHPESFERFLVNEFPMGRLGRLHEVSGLVAFLLSARASWITGANVVVDGGQRYPSARRFTAD